ncbi:MAG: AAA family ATPase [Faecalibacterium sp.]
MMEDLWDPYGEPPEEDLEHYDFLEDCELEDDGLPAFENLQTALHHVPPQSPAVIEGVLRKGHKMLLAGPSKAGKSFALIELAVCIASGTPWMNRFESRRGKVLYVNLEVDRASCLHRFKDVYTALGLPPQNLRNIDIWNLRGYCINWPHFVDICCSRARREQYDVIIIDPFYKLNAGRENNVFDMVQFCNGLDLISAVNGAAVIYAHHHSKGDQGWKNSMDRASGSGVFARDVDALLDIIELELPPDRQREGVTAWRIEGTLREFPSFEPVDVWFNYPIHVMERFDQADNIAPHSKLPSYQRAMNARKPKEQKLKERRHRLEAAIDVLAAQGVEVTTSSVAEYLDVTNKTIRYMVDEHPDFERDTKTGQIRRAHTVAPQE